MRPAPVAAVALVAAATVAFAAYQRAPIAALGDDTTHAEARWKQAGLQKFTYQMSMLCLCEKVHPEPFTVTEDHGRVIAMTDSAGQPIELTGKELPIDSLFADVRSNMMVDGVEMRVVYDSLLGYPRSITRSPVPGKSAFEPATLYLDNLRAIP